MVDQVSRNRNTYYLLLLKWKEHLQNVQYISINQQNQNRVNIILKVLNSYKFRNLIDQKMPIQQNEGSWIKNQENFFKIYGNLIKGYVYKNRFILFKGGT